MKRNISPLYQEGVTLRLLTASDLPMTLAWRNREEVRAWFKTSEPLAVDRHLNWFEHYQEKQDDYVFIVEVDERPVGQVAIYSIDLVRGCAEIGRFISAPYEGGKGYMRGAIKSLIKLATAEFGLRFLYLEVLAHNVRAIGLYRSLGFQQSGSVGSILQFSMSTRT